MDTSESPYSILEVAPDATPDEITQAYRRRAAACHPDRHGGDSRLMQQVNDAYALLSDPERRAAWDAAGDSAEHELLENAKRVLVIQMGNLIDNERVADLVQALRTNLLAIEKNARVARSSNQMRERYYQRRLRAFKAPAAEGDFLRQVIEGKLDALAASTRECDQALASLEMANKILDGYSYDVGAEGASAGEQFLLSRIAAAQMNAAG